MLQGSSPAGQPATCDIVPTALVAWVFVKMQCCTSRVEEKATSAVFVLS